MLGRKLGSKNKKQRKTKVQLEVIIDRYRTGESTSSIAIDFAVTASTISRWLKDAGVEIRSPGFRKGQDHHGWAGGKISTKQGYVLVRVYPDNPFFCMGQNKVAGASYALEHRLAMAQKLGRPLTDYETVHHVDGNKKNNSPNNLQLRVGRHGKDIALHCRDCGSHNILATDLR